MEDFLAVSPPTLLPAAPGRKNVELHGTVLCSWSNIQHRGGNIYSYYTRKPGGGNWEGKLALFRFYIREVAFGIALEKYICYC